MEKELGSHEVLNVLKDGVYDGEGNNRRDIHNVLCLAIVMNTGGRGPHSYRT